MKADPTETLRKYIRHVTDCEGIDYIPDSLTDTVCHCEQPFTAEELELLWALRAEAKRD